MSAGLPPTLIDLVATQLRKHMTQRIPGHCVRVDDLALQDAHAVADAILRPGLAADVHVLAREKPQHPFEIEVDRAVELRNRKQRPLLLLVPAGTSHAASSLDNSFEPLPLIGLLKKASSALERDLATSRVATCIAEVKQVLGRTRQVEPWARFLGAVKADPSVRTVGRQLWQVGLVPDLGDEGVEMRLRRNAIAVAALARPARPTARVADRLVAADVKDGSVRQALLSFFEQDAGVLSDPVAWARDLGARHAGRLTFEQWPLVQSQQAALIDIAVNPFRRDNGSIDPVCKLRLGDDGQLCCDVSPDQPGTVVVKWTTEPAGATSVASWRVEVLPPVDLRAADTVPIAATKVKGDKRRATLRVDLTEDDLTLGTLFVVRVRAQDGDGNDLDLQDGRAATADSDQFEVLLREHVPERNPRKTGAASLPEAVLSTAIDAGGNLSEDAPIWDAAGQVFGVRIGGRRMVLVRVSRVIATLQRRMAASRGEAAAFEAHSPLGEPIDPDEALPIPLALPPALAERRRKFLGAMAACAPRDVVEALEWDDDLRSQARAYLQSYRRALDSSDPQTRATLLAMDTLMIHVGTATDEVHGLVLLPTHPLRLAWIAAHDHLLRGWAGDVTQSGSSKSNRVSRIDLALVSRLSPANMPFTTVDRNGESLVYAEELTHGSALYLPPDVAEPQAASDAICAAIDVVRDSVDMSATAQSLNDRIRSYRVAHPGIGALRIMAINPGSGATLQRALKPIVLPHDTGAPDDHVIPVVPPRLEVIAYSDRLSYTDPVADLRQLQLAVASSEAERTATHLAPPMGLAARDLGRLVEDHEGHHLAVVQDLARGRVTDAPMEVAPRTAAFQDLLTPSTSERSPDNNSAEWYVTPALKARGSGRPESEIVETHRAHQGAVAANLGLGTATPALAIRLEPDDLRRLRAAHERADWVATLDRGIGLELFEDPLSTGLGGTRYLLDYAPDFLEGLGKRLTVTTAHHDEVLRILGDAMRSLGLSEMDGAASYVLGRLSLVSGRLALRLLGDTTLASEAVSLAALVAHLETRKQLDGRIVVPVDAHPEIFGSHVRDDDEPARRCDLLLVRVTQRSLRIECVEVKARRDAVLPVALADRIVDQLENTVRVLQRQFFATDPPRLDGALRRSRLAGLVHYYGERSAHYGLLAADRLDEVHRHIDRLEEQTDPPEITMRGYVVSLAGAAGFPTKHRNVPIAVLTADDLGRAGFTTLSGTRTQQPPSDDDRHRPPTDTGKTSADAHGESDLAPDDPAGAPHRPEGQSTTHPTETGTDRSTMVPDLSTVTVELGKDEAGSPVTWEVSTKGSPHAFVLGIPGQGKSVTTRRIINDFARQGLPSLIFDFHGDMAANPPPDAHVVDASAGLPFSPFELSSNDPRLVSQTSWEVAEIVAYVCGLGEIQRNHVYKGLRQAYLPNGDTEAPVVPTMEQFADAVEQVEQGSRGKNARDRVRPLTDFGLFADNPEGTFESTWGNGVVVDLSRLSLETVQLAASAFLLRKIYREMFRWDQTQLMRLAVVLDEAHRLAKDLTLPKLMKEGRKYGVSVVVASQGAADFHRDGLGNAGTKIVFRTNYPASKVAAGFLRGRDGQDLSRQIEQLIVGCAYVSTPDHAQARRVYMHA